MLLAIPFSQLSAKIPTQTKPTYWMLPCTKVIDNGSGKRWVQQFFYHHTGNKNLPAVWFFYDGMLRLYLLELRCRCEECGYIKFDGQ